MQNIKFKVSKNIVTLPSVEGVDSFIIATSYSGHVHFSEYSILKSEQYTPGTKVTVDAASVNQIAVYAIIDGEKVFLRRAAIRAPWTGIFDENYVSPKMFLEQANENTFPKAIIEDEQEVVEVIEDESVEIEEAIAVADEYKNADENFLQEKSDAELSVIVEQASLINHAELVSKASEELERRKNADEIEDEQEVEETKSEKAHSLVKELGFGNVWENYDRTRVYFDSKEVVENMRTEIEFFNDYPQKGWVDGREFKQPDMRRLVNGFDEVFYDFDADELVIEIVNWGAYVNDITNAIADDFKKVVDAAMNPVDAVEALSSDEINETIAGIEIEDEQEQSVNNETDYSDIITEMVERLKNIKRETNDEQEEEEAVDAPWMTPGTPEYYEYEYLPKLDMKEMFIELQTLVDSLKQGRVRYTEMQTLENEFNKRMGEGNQYRVERLIHFMIADDNGSEQKEIRRVQKQIEEEVEEEVKRWMNSSRDRVLSISQKELLNSVLADVRSTIDEVSAYGDAFMEYIKDEQGTKLF